MTTILDIQRRCVEQLTGEELVQLRTSMGLSQQQLADVLGTTPQAVLRWEKQYGKPTLPIPIAFMLRTLVEETQRLGMTQDETRQWFRSRFWDVPPRFRTT